MGIFDALFARIRKDRVYGSFIFEVRDGVVKKVAFHRDFLSIEEALHGLSSPRPYEEEPGGHDSADSIQQKRDRSAA